MARGRLQGGQRQIVKAVHPSMAAMAQQGRGLQPQTRPFALMEAINAATGQAHFDPLPRDPFNGTAFGPLDPLVPNPIDPIGENGRSEPRTWQYPVGWNLPGNGNREVPWQVLRAAADGVGVIRRCIEVRKKHVRDLKFTFGPTEEAIQAVYAADTSRGKQDVEQELTRRFEPDIARLKKFWAKPWRSNDLSFGQWANAVIEDYLVLDGVCVYPQMSHGGQVLDFKLVDPTTIKLLLDSYGNRPLPPHPAFQQILYGFPRGEWAASAVQDAEGNVFIENGFAASELFYYRENFRTHSPYGLSATEQALIDSRLYLQRQKWMLAEYDDGSTPLTWLETAAAADGKQLSLTQARQWQAAFNAKNAGNTAERLRTKVLPNGWKAVQMSTTDERYRPEYDLYLLKLLCSYFGVPITELGFTETQGLGSSGMHEAQADVSGRVGKRPDTEVLTDIINALSSEFLKMPPELEGKFADPVGANDMDSAQTDQIRQNGGVITVNDIRQSNGQALFPFKEANMPFIVGGPNGIIFLEGAKEAIDKAAQQAQMAAETQQMGTAGKLHLESKKLEDGQQARAEQRDFAREQMQAESETQKAAVTELQAFRTWRRRNPDPKRAFVFKYVTPDDGWPELENLGPDTVWYEGYEWLEGDELLKSAMSYLEWNARNPRRPRGPNGRFIKAEGLISALEKEGRRTSKDLPHIDAPSTVGSMKTGHGDITVSDYPDYGNGNGWHVYEGGEKRSTWPTKTAMNQEAERLRAEHAPKPAEISHAAQVRGAYERIRAKNREALQDLPRAQRLNRDSDWVGLADLRGELSGLTREQQDAAFRELWPAKGVSFIPQEDQKLLREADRAAAFGIGGEWNHLVSMPHPAPELHTESDVRHAYEGIRRPGHDWVGLADLREKLGGERESQDKVLREMIHRPDVRIIPIANSKALKPRDRAAALYLGGEDNHAISIGPHNIQAGAPEVPAYRMTGERARIERMALEDQLRFTKEGPDADALRERLKELTAGNAEDAARARQAVIDKARKRADVLGEIEERLIAGESPDSAERNARAMGERHGLLGDELDDLIYASALDWRDASRVGLTRTGAGPYDPAKHESVGGKIRRGQRTELVRPGYTLEHEGETIQIAKAVVEPARVASVPEIDRSAPIETQVDQAFDRILARPHQGLESFLYTDRPMSDPNAVNPDEWVHVREIRQELSHLSREEVDHALRELSHGGVNALTAYWPTKQSEITDFEREHDALVLFPGWDRQARSEGDYKALVLTRRGAELKPGMIKPYEAPKPILQARIASRGESVRTTLRGRTEEDARRALKGMHYSAAEWKGIAGDLGLTPGRNMAATKEIILAHVLNKAADADPKAQTPATEPVQPDSRWPGWLLDTIIATIALNGLISAMSLVLGGPVISGLLKAWGEWMRGWKPEMGDPVGRAQSWLRTQSPGTELFNAIESAITPSIRQAHLEGGLVGQESARALMAYQEYGDILNADPAVQFSINWGDWTPGHPEAAQLLLEPGGLERLLRESNITIKQVAAHRLDEIGKILGRGLAQGLSPEEIGRQLRSLAKGDEGARWAYMVAVTETSRALSAAAIGEYRASGLKFKGWMTAFDQRVCKICDHNAFNLDRTPRIVPIDARFPSGDMHPPGHPHCRCAPIPILEWPSRMTGSTSTFSARGMD